MKVGFKLIMTCVLNYIILFSPITLFRPWYVHFSLMCVGLISSKTPATRYLISKMPDFSKTPSKLFHTLGFIWGESVLHKQVIV